MRRMMMALVLVVVMGAGCAGPSPFVGEWHSAERNATLRLAEDGNSLLLAHDEAGELKAARPGTWRADEETRIRLEFPAEHSRRDRYTADLLDENELLLVDDDRVARFRRRAGEVVGERED